MTKFVFEGSHARVTGISGKVYSFRRDSFTGKQIPVKVKEEDIPSVMRLQGMQKLDTPTFKTAEPTSYRTVEPKAYSKKKRRKLNH